VSALRAYHVLYPGRISAENVADLLMLRPELPRSLIYCYEQVSRSLELIEGGPKKSEAHTRAGALYAQLRYADVSRIMTTGLHEYLTNLIDRTAVLGQEITKAYSF
jgi:uncharacterized alpha-E superfamily protein